jgi:hypothetical protein
MPRLPFRALAMRIGDNPDLIRPTKGSFIG